MKWLDALRIFNRDNPGKWCIPKTGTPEHQTVLDIMNGKHMRRQEKIQGSGLFDVFGKLYNMDKAKKDKKAARVRQIQDEYRALKAAEKAAAAAPVVASTPVVGSGFGDFLKFTFDKKNYMKENQARIDKKAAELRARELRARPFMQKEAEVASTPVVGSGKRGRPKGSKNKK
jgi:hypothetical protein